MTFRFKKFSIEQDKCSMKVGTDGVLLGAWANGGKRILDIGTGTGVIALMMAQRFPNTQVDAVEIEKSAALQATENFNQSAFASQLTCYNNSIQEYTQKNINENKPKYDAIVANPPYFINALKNPNQTKRIARHTDLLSYKDLLKSSYQLLENNGIASFILPFETIDTIESEAYIIGFWIKRLCIIRTKCNKQPKRVLIELSKTQANTIKEEQVLLNEDNGKTEWYDSLTQDFYIK